MTPASLLHAWLDERLDAAGRDWLGGAVASVASGGDRELYRCISLVARKLGKAALALDDAALARAEAARGGWNPAQWTVDQAARIRLLLATTGDGVDGGPRSDIFSRRLDQLCATADVDELVAFYRGLPLYPDAPRHRARAAEGVRSNMRVVFEAVAQANPYPAEQLDDDAWNQLVLKAIFVGATLDAIVGIDSRANARLARMLGDYAHERWAASRSISPELWRCVGPYATGPLLDDLARVLQTGTPPERAAAVLALRSSPDPDAQRLLDRHAAVRDAVAARRIDWKSAPGFN